MPFYQFDQNNSGGSFDVDDKVCHRLFIEADSEEEATSKAEFLGVYFNGCDDGIDCYCCGDRWYGSEEVESPHPYGDSIEEIAQYHADHYGWTTPDCRIFYKSGEVKEVFTNKNK